MDGAIFSRCRPTSWGNWWKKWYKMISAYAIINHEILHSFTNRMDSTVSYSLCNTIRQKHSLSCFSIYNIRIGNVHRSICKPVLGIVWYHREFEQKRRSYCTYIVRYMACHHAHRVRDRFLTRSSRQNLLIRLWKRYPDVEETVHLSRLPANRGTGCCGRFGIRWIRPA